jgi:hypothetical protein
MSDSPNEGSTRGAAGRWIRSAAYVASQVAVVLLVLLGVRYFYPPAPEPPTGQLNCSFRLAANAPPARRTASSIPVSSADLSATLTNRSIDPEIVMWNIRGSVSIGSQSVPMSGSLFIKRGRVIDGIMLFQEQIGVGSESLSIMTLNAAGRLDANERVAYIWFRSEPGKMAHPFRYRCKATVPA